MNSSPGPTSYRESHQAPGHGRRYDELLFSEGAYDAAVWDLERHALTQLLSRYFPSGPENALDFACGTGRITAFMVPRCKRIVGLDISEEMLAEARRKLPQVTFVRGDLTRQTDLLKAYAPFDCVTAFRFFLNAEPELRAQVLKALRDVMKPGGLLICNNHGNSASLWPLVRGLRRALGLPIIPNTLPFSRFVSLLADCGYQLLEVRGICFLPRGLFRIMPTGWWSALERAVARLRILDRFAIYQIYVARRLP